MSVYCAEHGIPTVDLEIVSFRRLANRVFREYGGLSYHYIGQGGKAVITWRVLGQLCDKLKYFRGISLSDISTVSAMCAQLDELRSCGITPTVLERASEQLGEGALADKLSDLSLISAAYGALLSADYDDPKGGHYTPRGAARGARFFCRGRMFSSIRFTALLPTSFALSDA